MELVFRLGFWAVGLIAAFYAVDGSGSPGWRVAAGVFATACLFGRLFGDRERELLKRIEFLEQEAHRQKMALEHAQERLWDLQRAEEQTGPTYGSPLDNA